MWNISQQRLIRERMSCPMKQAPLFRIALALLLALSAASSHARLSDKDLQALQLLVLGPKNNEVKSCLDASFGILEGLVAAAREPDSKVSELLMRGEMTASLQALREQQDALWKEHHSPAKLANLQYEWCLKERGLPPVGLGELGERCFSAAMVPASASLMKTGYKVSQEEATEKVMASWGEQAKSNWPKQVVSDIYAAATPEATLVVFRRVFVSCVVSNN